MKRFRRVFLIVLDSLGIGEAPDASLFSDEGSDTLGAIRQSASFRCPNLETLGLFEIEGVKGEKHGKHTAAVARMRETSMGKDTTIGHWEIAGLVSPSPLPTYPNGFPRELIAAFEKRTGYPVLCNLPYSGTEVIKKYGEEQMRTGGLIVYTSADSVFQIAAHEAVIPVEELYRCCEIAREMLVGEHGVGRVIARPFAGEYPFTRTSRRHDFSIVPPAETMLDLLSAKGLDTISIGKIYDIFAGKGITYKEYTSGNADGMEKTMAMAERDFHGLCFVNLVDFDMLYGHRNDVDGYATALSEFDAWLSNFLPKLRADDLLLITADHGCDPKTPSTDHSREYTPMLMYGAEIAPVDLGTRESFADISATVLEALGVDKENTVGQSFLSDALQEE
ncbi:MAG: phosphopentomutase [Ruminococcaceae bacterium]|nr:phosphopentomutase [Oscillospiraceae bacterium]